RHDRTAEDDAALVPGRVRACQGKAVRRESCGLGRDLAAGGLCRQRRRPAAGGVGVLGGAAVGGAAVPEVPVVRRRITGGREGHAERSRPCRWRCLDGDLRRRPRRGRNEDQKGDSTGQTPAHAPRISACGLPATATLSAIALKSPWTIIPG